MAASSMIMRLELENRTSFGEVAAVIGRSGGDVVAIDMIKSSKHTTIRDVTINYTEPTYRNIVNAVSYLPGVEVVNVSDRTFLVHLGGKIEVQPKLPIKNREDLSRVYTPGVARVCQAIAENPVKAYSLTIKRNAVAVVSDGSAVLGLGNIGPEAAIPVMEGKAMLFKQLGHVDAFPICLNTQDTEEIIAAVKAISPVFGGINLEDISSPRCFEIEARLAEELDIPVFHDDQHGTAVVVLAGLINACQLTGKRLEDIRIVVNGIGAAGSAICRMLLTAGVSRLTAVDQAGPLKPGVQYEHPVWNWLAQQPQLENRDGTLEELMSGADVFIGVSRANLLNAEHLKRMASEPIVFAMANPDPEVTPEVAEPFVKVLATGRSDYPNQVNNVLCFPGLFRGVLDCRATSINEDMKLAAAYAIASVVQPEELNEQYIIPSVFNELVSERVRDGVIRAAIRTRTARRVPPEYRD
ncbi:NAD-dependent malic enzyme [Paenibacillus sp. PAMC21692]|uniref:NAD-dependent malic enzyme n=1 Tax=Paenibacillus sp. PAMC21692 TaxID=2762320 RepID=UPI00164DC18F|nr:NAD-dependent malic enzyme [Paenibacillus sp. PAMC21692]QNK60205.1 NAD-dependent malic enzyme [Paenibacillus sp. PAMC21692]